MGDRRGERGIKGSLHLSLPPPPPTSPAPLQVPPASSEFCSRPSDTAQRSLDVLCQAKHIRHFFRGRSTPLQSIPILHTHFALVFEHPRSQPDMSICNQWEWVRLSCNDPDHTSDFFTANQARLVSYGAEYQCRTRISI